MAVENEAIEALTELGLTEYEARCFVALSQLTQGTAKEISRVADVPQSRVYDVTEQLHERGLIDIEEADPRRYIVLPVDHAIERLHREYSEQLETADEALQNLNSRPREEDGAWIIANRDDVRERVRMHVDDGDEEIYFHVAHENLLERDVVAAFEDAVDRDVEVYAEVPTEQLRTQIHEQLPSVKIAASELPLDAFEERVPGRLLMVDRETILLSAQQDGLVPGQIDETGLWGSDVGHGLVAWMRPLIVSRLDSLEFVTADQ